MTIISDPVNLEDAWNHEYTVLPRRIAKLIPPRRGVLVEVGCGKGQLTLPLAKLSPNLRIIALDNFMGPYSKDHSQITSAIIREGLKGRIRVVVSDYRAWLAEQQSETYVGAISSEFLPEIDSSETRSFLSECHRILMPRGLSIHSFLSTEPRNSRQRLLIEADSDPRWTSLPPKEWFSPKPGFVVELLESSGFVRVRTAFIKSNLTFTGDAARQVLRSWGAKEAFWTMHKRELSSKGMEVPDWVIVSAVKPPE